MRSSIGAPARLTRRSALALPVLAAAGAALVGCRGEPGASVSESPSGPAVSTPAATPASPGPHGGAMLETGWNGAPLSVEVGPAAVKDGYAVVRLGLSTTSVERVSVNQPFSAIREPGTMVSIRMLSLERGLVFRELSRSPAGISDGVTRDKPLELFPVFLAPGDGVESVELFLPQMGIATGVPVVADSEVDYEIDQVLAKADLDESDPGPFALEGATTSADGSSDTRKDTTSTTVTVAGDVTFAVDSEALSAQADGVLGSVVEQIEKYPSGGDMSITGHTDDVADDAHNQGLSDRRAEAVSERLRTLTDLSKWRVSASGKGETMPRMPNDSEEHRQMNRRVEISLTPSKPSEADDAARTPAATPIAAGRIPDPDGPVGRGSEGVDVTIKDKTVHMSIDGMSRVGEYLIGTVLLESDQEIPVLAGMFTLPNRLQSLRWGSLIYGVYSFTLLSGGTRYLEADYAGSEGNRVPVANGFVYSIEPGEAMRLPAVWPDTGEETVVLDIPGGDSLMVGERVVARLTDIPVVDA